MRGRADMSPAIMVIFRMSRALECVDAGLTPSQYRMMKLAAAGGERSTRLAQRLAVAKPTLTPTAMASWPPGTPAGPPSPATGGSCASR